MLNAFGVSLEPLRLPSMPIQSQLRKLHKLDVMEVAVIREAAKRIGSWELTETNFEAALKQFHDLLQSLHRFAISERNLWMLGICKAVSIALGHYLGGKLPLDLDNVRRLSKMAKPFQSRQGVEHFSEFYHEILSIVCSVYRVRYNTVYSLQQLGKADLSQFDDFRRPDEVSEAIQKLLTGITELRRYGVKSCTMQDGLMHASEFAWVMHDGADITSLWVSEGAQLAQFDPPLVIIALARRKDIRTLKPTQNKEKVGITPFRRMTFNFDSYTSANLYADGRVALDMMWGMVSLKDVFAEAGTGDLYDLFHLLQLLRTYDLVMSVDKLQQHRVPAWPVRQRRPADLAGTEPTWRQLVVPRIRMLRDLDGLASGIEQEIAADLAFTAQYGGKATESREIQGYLRRLLPGRQASDRARLLAWEERMWEIPEGYTYVKNHDWGTGPNRTAGHEAIRRSI